jgi:hypothetical protein
LRGSARIDLFLKSFPRILVGSGPVCHPGSHARKELSVRIRVDPWPPLKFLLSENLRLTLPAASNYIL